MDFFKVGIVALCISVVVLTGCTVKKTYTLEEKKGTGIRLYAGEIRGGIRGDLLQSRRDI